MKFKYAVWCDGTVCLLDEVEEMRHMSDDFKTIEASSEIEAWALALGYEVIEAEDIYE